MPAKLEDILPKLDHQSLKLEKLFFSKLDIPLKDKERETIPLSLYLPASKLPLLQENFSGEFLQNEARYDINKNHSEKKPVAARAFIKSVEKLKYILPFQAVFKTVNGVKPSHIVFKFIENPFEFHYQVNGDSIAIDVPDIVTILQTAHLLSRWPFLKVENFQLPSEKIKANLENIPHFQKRYFFNRIILGRRPSAGLLFLDKIGLLKEFLPELTAGKNLSQNRFHAYDVFEHSIRALDGVQKADPMIRWSALLHDIGKVPTRVEKTNGEATFHNHEMLSARMVVPIMKRMGIPKHVGQRVRFLVRNHMFHYTKEWSDKAIRRFLKKISSKDLEDLILLRLADRKGSGKKTAFPEGLQMLIEHIEKVKENENELKIRDLNINGHDLMELGIEPGPIMGEILNNLLELVKCEQIPNQRDLLIQKVSEYYLHALTKKI